jgi:dihydrofolate reductase
MPWNLRAIIACDSHGGIARNGVMPWPKNKKDMAHFQKLTRGSTLLMGRKTWEAADMPSPLPNRRNIVLTTDTTFNETESVNNITDSYLTTLMNSSIVYVIGGSSVFHHMLDFNVDVINLTRIAGNYECDTHINLNRIQKEYTLIESVSVDKLTTFETHVREK